ncbi:MAG: hypothetical protein QNK36_15175 [Colwellia sp.]|nr:hypothetical protein [Colwellia sp.]
MSAYAVRLIKLRITTDENKHNPGSAAIEIIEDKLDSGYTIQEIINYLEDGSVLSPDDCDQEDIEDAHAFATKILKSMRLN